MTEHRDCHILALLFLLFFLYDLPYVHILGKHPHTGCLIQSGGHCPDSAPGIWASCSPKPWKAVLPSPFFSFSCLFIHDLTNNELFLISVIWPLFSFPYMSKLCLPVWVPPLSLFLLGFNWSRNQWYFCTQSFRGTDAWRLESYPSGMLRSGW